MEQWDDTYQERLARALEGRKIRADSMPRSHRGRPMYAFWGEELGFTGGDVHQNRAYRIYLDHTPDRIITSVYVVVEGELISPCSGYYREALDQFDYGPVLAWCLQKLEKETPDTE